MIITYVKIKASGKEIFLSEHVNNITEYSKFMTFLEKNQDKYRYLGSYFDRTGKEEK